MIGIKAVGVYYPSNAIDNIKQGKSFGESKDFVRDKIGGISLPRMSHGEDSSDLAVNAVAMLLKSSSRPNLSRSFLQR